MVEVKGLDLEDAKQLLRANNLKDESEWNELIEKYRGIPLALDLVSREIQKNFNGRIKEFNTFSSITADIFREVLEREFRDTNLLGYLERQILVHLAEELSKQPELLTQTTQTKFLNDLKVKLESSVSTAELLEKIEFLSDLCLVERSENIATGEVLLGLQPLFRKYAIRNRESLARGAA